MSLRTILAVCLLAFGPIAGCASQRGPYAPMRAEARDPEAARRLTAQALRLLEHGDDPERAESLLREALSHDLYNGPAHNALGLIYLEKGLIYEAAGEFEWARRLMPGHPDPRVNLGIALERGGRVDAAIEAFETALEVMPGHIAAIQGLALAQVKHGRANAETEDLLAEVAYRGETEAWRDWARRVLPSIGD